jgi:hypothetical protein
MHHAVPPIAVILDIVRKLATKISVHATRFIARPQHIRRAHGGKPKSKDMFFDYESEATGRLGDAGVNATF